MTTMRTQTKAETTMKAQFKMRLTKPSYTASPEAVFRLNPSKCA